VTSAVTCRSACHEVQHLEIVHLDSGEAGK
jgi:hypothetical protein